jgi:hypothetical protein
MLRAAHRRLPRLLALPVFALSLVWMMGGTVALAGPESRHHNFRWAPAATQRTPVVQRRSVHGERRHIARYTGRFRDFPRYRGYFGNTSAYLEAANHGYVSPAIIGNDPATPAPRQYGPLSFADLRPSTGIQSAPASPPLFMRLNGRQVVADDGEKYLWRAGPKIVDLDSPVRQRRATQGQPRRAYAGTTSLDAPKIIVVRP